MLNYAGDVAEVGNGYWLYSSYCSGRSQDVITHIHPLNSVDMHAYSAEW